MLHLYHVVWPDATSVGYSPRHDYPTRLGCDTAISLPRGLDSCYRRRFMSWIAIPPGRGAAHSSYPSAIYRELCLTFPSDQSERPEPPEPM